jgi:hypothetical protein
MAHTWTVPRARGLKTRSAIRDVSIMIEIVLNGLRLTFSTTLFSSHFQAKQIDILFILLSCQSDKPDKRLLFPFIKIVPVVLVIIAVVVLLLPWIHAV